MASWCDGCTRDSESSDRGSNPREAMFSCCSAACVGNPQDTARPPDTLTRCNCEMRRRERLIVHHLSGWRASKVQCRHFARAVVLQICCCSLASARKRARHQPQAAKQCRITLIMGAEGTTKCKAAHRTCVNAAVLEQTGPDANAKHARAFLCMMCARMGQRVVRAARQNLLELGCSGN